MSLRMDLTGIPVRILCVNCITDRARYASDASPYLYVPNVVVQPRNIDHVAGIFQYCLRKGRHATFRAGGTKFSGQSQGDDILIDVRQHWSGWTTRGQRGAGSLQCSAPPGSLTYRNLTPAAWDRIPQA